MFDRLWQWAQEFIEGPGEATVPVERRIVILAESWGVAVEVARRVVYTFAAQQGVGQGTIVPPKNWTTC